MAHIHSNTCKFLNFNGPLEIFMGHLQILMGPRILKIPIGAQLTWDSFRHRHLLWLFQPISHSNACKVLNLYGPKNLQSEFNNRLDSLLLYGAKPKMTHFSLLQIVFSKYGSTLVPRRERGYSQFSCYIGSALASTGNKKISGISDIQRKCLKI